MERPRTWTRREVLNSLGAVALVGPQVPESLPYPEQSTRPVSYGFTPEETPARRTPNINEQPFHSFDKGVLLRYVTLENEGGLWAEIVLDSFVRYRGFPRARGPIYVPAEMLAPLQKKDITPINPQVPPEEKWIEVILARPQKLIAWEGETKVNEAPVSAGLTFPTPTGWHRVLWKRWARQMQGLDSGGWDLPGVPVPTYFTWRGHAIHGTYWHNNFGEPMSHGCVNLRNEDALWIFRWTTPHLTDFNTEHFVGSGTRVFVHY